MVIFYKSNFGNKEIDEKYSYFINYFQYCNTKSYKKTYGFPHNHLTLLEKIRFSLENQETLFKSSRKVHLGILNQTFFDVKNDSISKKERNKILIKKIKANYQSLENFKNVETSGFVLDLILNLNGARGLEDYQYFETLLNRLYHLLFCACHLDKHKVEIQYLAQCLIAEYFRRGFHEDDISGLNGILKKIFKFNELKDEKKIAKTEFPLPKDILEKKKDPKYKELINAYLKSESHNKLQLFGLMNYLEYDISVEFIFKIENVEIDQNDPLDLKIFDVYYFRFSEKYFEKYSLSDRWLTYYDFFFNNDRSIFASINIDEKSLLNGRKIAQRNLENSISMLRNFTNCKGGTISNNVLYHAGTLKSIQLERPNSLALSKIEIEELQEIFIELNQSKPEFQNIDKKMNTLYKLYIKGLSQNNEEDVITYFWKYLESAYSFIQHNKAEYIIQSVSKIIAKEEILDLKKEIAFNLHLLAMNNCENDTHGIPSSYYNANRERDIYSDSDAVVSELKEFPINTFMKDLISKYEENTDFDKIRNYYSSILYQVYEQRNFIQHNGVSNHKTLNELKFYYTTIIGGWQRQIYITAKNNLTLQYNEVIQKACEQQLNFYHYDSRQNR